MTHYTGTIPTSPKRKPDWRNEGLCQSHEDPNLWYPSGGSIQARAQIKEAQAICFDCPVRVTCARWALENREIWGVWGGLTEAQRRRVLRIRVVEATDDPPAQPRKGGRPRAACGTPSAYDRHHKLGEPIDQACRDAHAAATRERKARKQAQQAAA